MYQKPNIKYRPPETDSEDEYDGFYFGDDHVKKTNIRWTEDKSDQIYNALMADDLALFKELQKKQKFNVDENINGGFTALMQACKNGYFDFVEYLLVELRASPNKHFDSYTPLMLACDCDQNNQQKENRVVEKIVHLLLQYGAEINTADKYGTTPFMLACKHGYITAVRLMIKKVSFDNVDNMGCTPIFYAIEHNHPEIVKMLVEAGADASIPNAKGYTPKQVAQFHGFYDLLELLPKQKESYSIPSSFLTYGTLSDLIPRLFLKTECPEYFQEIYQILMALQLEKLLEFFAKERLTLQDFLCIDNARLKEIGIAHPIYHMKIQKGILDFHLHHWKAMSIARVNKSAKDNFYEILMITANHMRDLVVLKASLRYLIRNMEQKKLGNISSEQLDNMERYLRSFQNSVFELRLTAKYLSSFSPKQNPLYIDYEEIQQERKSRKIRRFFKYTSLIIGISVFICIKIRVF